MWPSATTVAESIVWKYLGPHGLRAADGVRAVDLDAVEGDEQAAAEALERGEGTLLQVGEAIGVHTVEQIADPVVAGDVHAEEGVAVGAGGLLLHAALELEEGGSLEEEGGEGARGGVGDGVALVGAAAGIGQTRGGLAEAVQQGIENRGHILWLKAAPEKSSHRN